MKIDKKHVREAFAAYVKNYDDSDEKIKLKIDHTYRVSELCQKIAQSQELLPQDAELSWLTGMLHDIGRFEQLKNYHTFNDAESVDHAGCGADILFREGKIRDYIADPSADALLEQVIRVHSIYRLPETLTRRERIFAEILRDADKIDIIKVNVEVPIEEIYNVTTQELANAEVTESVMQSFYERHAVLRSLKRTAVDNLAGHISLVYELVYPLSLKIVMEQGYLKKMMEFQSENKKTQEQFAEIRKQIKNYVLNKEEEEVNEKE